MNVLKLIPFSEKNTDLVLGWRNSDRIRLNMLDDSIIPENEHKGFLESLALDSSRAYFVLEMKGSPVACIYFTGLGKDEVTWGGYIGPEKPIPGLFLALVVIAAKYAFRLPSTRTLCSEVASYNQSPIKLNRFLGISEAARRKKPTSSGREVEFIEYRLKRYELDSVLESAKKVMPSSMKGSCEELNLETANAGT